jgi:hypothetical protein
MVNVDDDPRTQIEQTLEALRVANGTAPTLFKRQSVVVRLRRDDADLRRAWLEELSIEEWNDMLIQRVIFIKHMRAGTKPVFPTPNILRAVQGRTEYPFPVINRVAHAPFFTSDGRLVGSEVFTNTPESI